MAADPKTSSKASSSSKPASEIKTFADLGLDEVLCQACAELKYKEPTPIQKEAIPAALKGNDVIGIAETGSGKTVAFSLPVLQSLLNSKEKKTPSHFALVLTPTRELAFQIKETFEALGATIGLKCAVLTGGLEKTEQAIALAKNPHVIIATPGRIVDHLTNTKGFHLRGLQFLILDEADRLLEMDFEKELEKLLAHIPRERRTFLFSATLTTKVERLQRASLKNPVKVEVSSVYKTVDTLIQRYLFVPEMYRDCYLVFLLHELKGNSFLIFCSTCVKTQRLTLFLRELGFKASCLNGEMSQPKRLGALAKFKSQQIDILIATDVASRGLDIPQVDVVVNYDLPQNSKDYIHRVGRTARAGRSGHAINMVTQYNVEIFQRIEHLIGVKMDSFPCEESVALQFIETVNEAKRHAAQEMKTIEEERTEVLAEKRKNNAGGSKSKKVKYHKKIDA